MKKITGFLYTFLVIFSVVNIGNASTISFNGSTGVVSSTGNLLLQQFDPLLGSLTAVDLAFDYGFSASFVGATETPSDSGTISAGDNFVTSNIVKIAGPTAISTLISHAGTAFSVSVPPTYRQIVSGGSSYDYTYVPVADFIGLGFVDFWFHGFVTDTSTASNGILRGLQDYLYLVNAEITYTYDDFSEPLPPSQQPVPEPATIFLFGLGLLGLAGIGRRKK